MLPQLNAAHFPRLSDDTLPIFSKEDWPIFSKEDWYHVVASTQTFTAPTPQPWTTSSNLDHSTSLCPIPILGLDISLIRIENSCSALEPNSISLSSFQREQRVLRWRAKRRRQKVKERAVAELAATKRKNRKVLAIGRERVSGRFVRSKSALEFIPWSTVTAASAEARF